MISDIILTTLINGSTYALLAIGFSLIFGVARIVNIAHTAFYMVAAYCIFFGSYKLGLNPFLSMLGKRDHPADHLCIRKGDLLLFKGPRKP